MDSGLSSTEALLLGQNNRGGMFGGNGDGAWVFFLFFLLAWGGDGFGFGNNGTANQINNDFLYTNLSNELGRGHDRIENTLGQGFTQIANTQFQNQKEMIQGFGGVQQGISNLQHGNDIGFCHTNSNIDSVKYALAENTCKITTNATANTQAILNKLCDMEMNAKDQQIAELTSANQTQAFQLSQQAQNAYLIGAIRPTPIPAYQVQSPYVSANYYNGYGGCNGSCYYAY
jgi:hypothetical protein